MKIFFGILIAFVASMVLVALGMIFPGVGSIFGNSLPKCSDQKVTLLIDQMLYEENILFAKYSGISTKSSDNKSRVCAASMNATLKMQGIEMEIKNKSIEYTVRLPDDGEGFSVGLRFN